MSARTQSTTEAEAVSSAPRVPVGAWPSAPRTTTAAAPLARLTFVCTANRCRSPLAEGLTRQLLADRGLTAHVSSVGLLAPGAPTPPVGVQVAAAYGIDLSGHRSVQISTETVRTSDIILTMTRAQAREIAAQWPDATTRVFTIKQFRELTLAHGVPRRALLTDYVASIGEARPRASLLGNPASDEIADPMGQAAPVWREVIADLRANLEPIITAWSPLLVAVS